LGCKWQDKKFKIKLNTGNFCAAERLKSYISMLKKSFFMGINKKQLIEQLQYLAANDNAAFNEILKTISNYF
jgi:hypothetical protein